ncbi:MAG: Crp/Fnr family transcriptional regulator [Cyclobacteriaceae bacterium]|nr:Crp/Fnr family transcriptional regulator [Cyclobacteriaceae bacterium]MCK5210244.1 Crp/Fnr family transcriptional regulator [Cyclobacteriaceae bacterium]MCK5277890.1 Crp/Fnr family transcriptional regulator [Cyclobacteriaceae bacterium]MCK5370316.1 Crp/Fnr family transcriptional regulator [Cyclobacteriaceae bacterium]MCK5471453.1 Crp/Fnr family transcriptional regulator [Cyclobacteriaceae bacterium]
MRIPCTLCAGKEHSLFSDLPREDLDVLSLHKTCIRYKKGQTLFYEGTRPMGLFCINSGKVKVYKISSEGKEQILKLGKPGDFLGYRALISEEFYNSSATVIEEGAMCYIPKADFLEILQKNPTFFRKMAKRVAHELGLMEQKLVTIAQKSVRERLAATLIMLKETYGMEDDESNLIDIALSREDLANIIGTATETVIRLLSDFKTQKLISLQGKKIKVLNPKGLVREADFYGR